MKYVFFENQRDIIPKPQDKKIKFRLTVKKYCFLSQVILEARVGQWIGTSYFFYYCSENQHQFAVTLFDLGCLLTAILM